jgi:hypothetical protein
MINSGIRINIFYKNLYNDIKKIMERIKINKKEIKVEKINDNPNNYLLDNDFTSKEIKKYILNNLNESYKITYKNNIIIYFTKKNINKIVESSLIYKMIYIIILLKELFKRNYEQKVIYFETNKKKEFPKEENKILDSNNVNTALTFIEEEKNGDIIIYRKEECLKVLIHELIHSNCIDEDVIKSKESRNFRYIFCTNYKILLNEGITETLACIINLFIIGIKEKKTYEELEYMYKKECMYSNYICSKIKSYYKINNIKDILKKTNNNKECITYFPQNTNVFSYYFIKNILINNHIKFGKIYKKYNKDYKINDEKFNKDIIKVIINEIKKDILDKRLKKIKDNNKSLKMSYYEM